MAGAKEIRTQISSIKSTQKITSAMEMVAASKMRRAQDRMAVGKPYATRIRQVVGHIANANPEYQHQYMESREIKRVGYIRSEEHTSELQSRGHLVCRLLLEKKKT